jgi:hypothetical protein
MKNMHQAQGLPFQKKAVEQIPQSAESASLPHTLFTNSASLGGGILFLRFILNHSSN